VKRVLVVLVFAALAAPAGAAAHATLLATSPRNGAVLARAPVAVIVRFDDTIRVGSGNAAVSNATGSSVLGGLAVAHGRTLSLPLRARLANGSYSVRWSIVSDDGHRQEGVLAFAVGSGATSPHSVLGSATPLTWSDVLLRTLYFLGLLAAGGTAAFWLLARRQFGDRLRRPVAQLLFVALLAAFLGGSGIVHSATAGTRFALVLKLALVVALVAGAAAALAPAVAWLLPVSVAGALALLLAPTLSGHALDPGQSHALSVTADLVHVGAAAVWFGGLLSLAVVVPHVTGDELERTRAARRFSAAALVAVAALGASGLGRTVTELSAVHQAWSTSYGRTLLVKTALFVPLLAVGWLNRTFLIGVFSRLRQSVVFESAVVACIVIAVAVLTELRPGKTVSGALAATPVQGARPPVLPAPDAVVDARELGSTAVAVARTPGRAVVTLIGSDGTGVSARVVVDGRPAGRCGSGCYRARAGIGPVRVAVNGRTMLFDVGADAPSGEHLLRAVTRAYRNSKTIVFDEALASSPRNAEHTRFTVVAPNRLSYAIRGGPSAVVIGSRRWDRERTGAPWLESQQTPLDVTQPYWHTPTNVHLVAPGVLTFLDRSIPAWFRVTIADGRPSVMKMTAPAHFMTDRYVGFDGPADVSPPSR
jgi:copper transport protein